MRTKLRAWIVSIVAPHTPVLPSLVKRHGPMPHILQHMPAEPMLQAGIASARVNAVPMPNASARMSICCAAGSAENCCGVFFSFAMIFSSSVIARSALCDEAIPLSLSLRLLRREALAMTYWLFVHLLNRAHAGARPQRSAGFFHLLSEGHALDILQC